MQLHDPVCAGADQLSFFGTRIDEDRTKILKSGLDLAVQCRKQAKTEVGGTV